MIATHTRQVKGQFQPHASPATGPRFLQRKCACGGTLGLFGECAECSKKKRLGLQTKLKINEPGDVYEQEADRIADQVMAMSDHSIVNGGPSRIQRISGQLAGQRYAAPASVDQALASTGRPLEPGLRRDMEQRFGYDFSQVRVHSGTAAERSAHDVNAIAYTVGHNIVFGAGRFAPDTREGQRLLAHELTHVRQQLGGTGPCSLRAIQRQTQGSQLTAVPETPLTVVARRIAKLALGPHQHKIQAFRGPVLTVIRDTVSGEIFVGLNTGVPPKLADVIYEDILRHHADIWSGKVQVVHTDPIALGGGHSEINSLNRAVLAHETNIGHKMTRAEYETFKSTQLEMQNVWLKGADRSLTIAASCEHCVGIGSGVPTTPVPAPTSPPAKTVSGEIPKEPPIESPFPGSGLPEPELAPEPGFWGATRSGFKAGLKEAFSLGNIAMIVIPEAILRFSDLAAAEDAIKTIRIKFLKEGFAKGVAAAVAGWSEEEVGSNLMNRVTDYRLRDLEDPGGLLKKTYIFQLAKQSENYAVRVGYRFSSSKTLKWRKALRDKGLKLLAESGYYQKPSRPTVTQVYQGTSPFGTQIFEEVGPSESSAESERYVDYDFIDKLAWALHDTTDRIADEAIEKSEKQKRALEAEARTFERGHGRMRP